MRIISVALFVTTILILMTGVASATIVEQKLGQYDVTFDLTNTSLELNSSASKWNDSQEDGWVFVDLKNKPGTAFAEISIVHSNSGIVVYSPGYAENLQESGWKNVQTYTRAIDGNKDAILTTGEGSNGIHIYWASYKPNRNTLVEIKSWMPLDKGTGDLLNTIHVGNLQGSYPSEGENNGSKSVKASGMSIGTSSAAGLCHISTDRTVGFADENDLDQYNTLCTLSASDASDYLRRKIDGNQAMIFDSGYAVSIDNHDELKSMTRIESDNGEGWYWINDGTITCES